MKIVKTIIPILLAVLLFIPPAEAGIIDWWCDSIGWFCDDEIQAQPALTMNLTAQDSSLLFSRGDKGVKIDVIAVVNGSEYDVSSRVDWWKQKIEDNNWKFGANLSIPDTPTGGFIANNLEDIIFRVESNFELSKLKQDSVDGFNYFESTEKTQFGYRRRYVQFDFSDILNLFNDIPLTKEASSFDYNGQTIYNLDLRFDVSSKNFARGQMIELDPSVTILETTVQASQLFNLTQETNITHISVNGTGFLNATSILGYYPLDTQPRTASDIIFDYSQIGAGTDDDMTRLFGTDSWTRSGLLGGALDLDGVGGWRAVSASYNFGRITNQSLSMWIKPRDVDQTNVQALFSSRLNGDLRTIITINVTDVLQIMFTNSTTSTTVEASGTTDITDGVWHHIAFVMNDTGGKLYLDNSLEVEANYPVKGIGGATAAMYLGMREANADWVLNATVDDVVVANFDLSAAQVSDIFNNNTQRFEVAGEQHMISFRNNKELADNSLQVNITESFPGSISYKESKIEVKIGTAGINNYSSAKVQNPNAWYRFDRNTTFVQDYGTGSTNLTCSDCPNNVDGVYFTGRNWTTGTEEYNNTASLPFDNNMTLLMWVNSRSTAGGQDILAMQGVGAVGNTEWEYSITTNSGGGSTSNPRFNCGGAVLSAGSGANWPDNEWHLVGVTVVDNIFGGGSEPIEFILDGEVKASSTIADTCIAGITTPTNPFRIGGAGDGADQLNITMIDGVMVWNEILTEEQMMEIYIHGPFSYHETAWTELNEANSYTASDGISTDANYTHLDFRLTGGNSTLRMFTPSIFGDINISTSVVAAAGDTTPPNVTILHPFNVTWNNSIVDFNVTAVDDSSVNSCLYSLDGGVTNFTMTNAVGNTWNATNTTMSQGQRTVTYFCDDATPNLNNTETVTFTIDSIPPTIDFVSPTPADNSQQTSTTININYTTTDTNPTYSFLSIDSDVIGWYTMETNVSGQLLDRSNSGRYCDEVGSVLRVDDGKFGGGYNISGGSGNFLNCSHVGADAFTFPGNFTLSTWFNMDDLGGGNYFLIADTTSDGPSLEFGVNFGNQPYAYITDFDFINEAEAASPDAVSTGIWYHAAYVRDEKNITLYVDGVQKAQTDASAIGSLAIAGANETIQLGRGLKGTLDDFIAFNRSLTADEVIELYNSTIRSRTLVDLTKQTHTFSAFSVDLGGNINQTSRNIEILDPRNVSIDHIDFQLNETIFDSASYVQIANVSFNLSDSSVLNVLKGVGQVRKFTGGSASTVAMRVTINNVELFDANVRTVSDLNDRGVFNIPINSTVANAGSNQLIVEVKDSGAGSINLSKFELHLDTNRTENDTNLITNIQRTDGTYSSTSFIQLANFTFPKSSFNTSTMIDVVHTFAKTSGAGATTPRCYLKNNVTNEVTPTYYRYLASSTDTGSSGMGYRSKIKTTGSETWEMFCSSSDTDTINSNVTFYALEMGDHKANEIQGFQNETQISGLTGSNNLLLTATHTVRDGKQMEFTSTIVMQSDSGAQQADSSPSFFINSSDLSETDCKATYQRSLSSASDVGTAKIYSDCDSSLVVGNSYTFNLYADVAAGETLDIINASFLGYESNKVNTTQGIVQTSVTITSPINNASVSGNVSVLASINDPAGLGWFSNVTLQYPNGTPALDITNQTLQLNTTQTSFNSSLVSDGPYQLNWTIFNSIGRDTDLSNITIANDAVFREDIQIWVEEILIANILDFTL